MDVAAAHAALAALGFKLIPEGSDDPNTGQPVEVGEVCLASDAGPTLWFDTERAQRFAAAITTLIGPAAD